MLQESMINTLHNTVSHNVHDTILEVSAHLLNLSAADFEREGCARVPALDTWWLREEDVHTRNGRAQAGGPNLVCKETSNE